MNRFKNDSQAYSWGSESDRPIGSVRLELGFERIQKHFIQMIPISMIGDQSVQRRSYSDLHCIEHQFIQ